MNKVTSDVVLSFYDDVGDYTIVASQNDNLTRDVKIELIDDFKTYIPQNTNYIYMKQRLPNGLILPPTLISKSNWSESTNVLSLTLTDSMLNTPGISRCELILVKSTSRPYFDENGLLLGTTDQILTSQNFNIFVRGDTYGRANITFDSEDAAKTLYYLVLETQRYADSAETIVIRAESAAARLEQLLSGFINGHIIIDDNGVQYPPRKFLHFVDSIVTDVSKNNRTDVSGGRKSAVPHADDPNVNVDNIEAFIEANKNTQLQIGFQGNSSGKFFVEAGNFTNRANPNINGTGTLIYDAGSNDVGDLAENYNSAYILGDIINYILFATKGNTYGSNTMHFSSNATTKNNTEYSTTLTLTTKGVTYSVGKIDLFGCYSGDYTGYYSEETSVPHADDPNVNVSNIEQFIEDNINTPLQIGFQGKSNGSFYVGAGKFTNDVNPNINTTGTLIYDAGSKDAGDPVDNYNSAHILGDLVNYILFMTKGTGYGTDTLEFSSNATTQNTSEYSDTLSLTNSGFNRSFGRYSSFGCYADGYNGYYKEDEIVIVDIPSVSGEFNYDGSEKSATITDTQPSYYTVSGDTSATEVGTYTVIFTLKDTTTSEWSDGTTAPKNFTWIIKEANGIPHADDPNVKVSNIESFINKNMNTGAQIGFQGDSSGKFYVKSGSFGTNRQSDPSISSTGVLIYDAEEDNTALDNYQKSMVLGNIMNYILNKVKGDDYGSNILIFSTTPENQDSSGCWTSNSEILKGVNRASSTEENYRCQIIGATGYSGYLFIASNYTNAVWFGEDIPNIDDSNVKVSNIRTLLNSNINTPFQIGFQFGGNGNMYAKVGTFGKYIDDIDESKIKNVGTLIYDAGNSDKGTLLQNYECAAHLGNIVNYILYFLKGNEYGTLDGVFTLYPDEPGNTSNGTTIYIRYGVRSVVGGDDGFYVNPNRITSMGYNYSSIGSNTTECFIYGERFAKVDAINDFINNNINTTQQIGVQGDGNGKIYVKAGNFTNNIDPQINQSGTLIYDIGHGNKVFNNSVRQHFECGLELANIIHEILYKTLGSQYGLPSNIYGIDQSDYITINNINNISLYIENPEFKGVSIVNGYNFAFENGSVGSSGKYNFSVFSTMDNTAVWWG